MINPDTADLYLLKKQLELKLKEVGMEISAFSIMLFDDGPKLALAIKIGEDAILTAEEKEAKALESAFDDIIMNMDGDTQEKDQVNRFLSDEILKELGEFGAPEDG